MLRRTIGEHVELVTSLAGDLWPILADPGQLEQVLVNLAVNARDAMPAGGTLTIDTSNITVDADTIAGGSRARQGRNVRLRVSDTGTGMPAEVVAARIRAVLHHQGRRRGTGLGLATVYGILTQAGGRTSGSTPNPATARPSPSRCRSPRRQPSRPQSPRPTSGNPRERPSWSSRTRQRCAR